MSKKNILYIMYNIFEIYFLIIQKLNILTYNDIYRVKDQIIIYFMYFNIMYN